MIAEAVPSARPDSGRLPRLIMIQGNSASGKSAAAAASGDGRRLVVKFGIDPTAADVHVGHAVPMLIASRLQRMGH